MAKATSELASTPTQSQASLSFKKPPAKKTKTQPSVFIFRLCEEHPKYYEGASVFPPRFTVPNRDTVIFNYGTEEEPNLMPRQIRYLDGFATIYIDEQETNGPVADAIVNNQKNAITFENGHLVVPAWNKVLYNYLISSNQCEQNKNKARQVKNVYKLLDFTNNDASVVELGKKKDLAYDMARNTSPEDMIPHAKFLGIPFIHPSTGEERDYDAIREDYKAKALESPENFLLFASNPRVKAMYFIEEALSKNIITTELVKGQLHWSGSKQLIGLINTNRRPSDAIADFATTEEGDSFMKILKVQLSV